MRSNRGATALSLVLLAGLAGGLAEIAWIAVFSWLTGRSGAEIARQVAESVAPSLAGAEFAALAGIAIHLGLALLVAFGFAAAVWPWIRPLGVLASFVAAVAVLVVIWAFNFMVLLPALNPGFVHLLPPPATLASKILFALAMAAGINARELR